ncbi:MAG: PilZ domain-containing protein [Candidatus Omnitrophica bacterium]|nr:PilZ domain-containing protein [Candidatus Omnitrophota bacterium]
MEDRRLFERFNVNFPVKFVVLDSNKEGTGRVIDISASGGGLIVTAEQLHPPAALEIWLQIPDNKEPFHTTGKVVWSSMIEPETYRVGVQFDQLDLMGLSRVLKYKDK